MVSLKILHKFNDFFCINEASYTVDVTFAV